jgi:uncharacterized repeat protein (TIGR01451 family)
VTHARLTLVLALLASPAWAQNYEISWWSVDGGGAMGVSGGSYELGATAGQPDAGGPFAGGPYALHSGFWAVAAGGLGPQADLSITKTDGQATAVPGEPVTYTIVAGNAGPSPVTNATVADTPPAALTGVTWTCTATPGSSCPPSGNGAIGASVNLLMGGTATFTLTGTIAPGATGTLSNTVSITVPPGVTDPDATDNQATDTDTLTPEADLSLAKSDSPDPVATGALLTYTIVVTNQGPSTSPSMTITDPLPPGVGFVSATPGAPTCTHASGTVTCALGSLAPGANATVIIQAVAGPGTGVLANTATVAGGATDPLSANNADTETTTVVLRAEGELAHGTNLRAELAGVGPAADVDLYRLRQQPHASYEIVVDEAAGDVSAGSGPSLDRVGPDGSTVLQSSLPVGVGSARSLRFANTTSLAVDAHFVRVRSASCGSDCGPDDTYRLRAWETTSSIPRFNNSGSQVTVLLLQNASSAPIAGTVYAWDAGGTLSGQQAFDLAPHALLVLNTGALVPGGGGSLTVAHDGPFAALVGKTVALEPATGYSFDSPLVSRPR